MVLKIFKGIWFLSLLGWLALFLYIYASLPEEVMVRQKDTAVIISREAIFYSSLALVAIVNALVFIMGKLYKDEAFLSWFYGLIISLNLFFIIGLNFISVVNSAENYRFSDVGIIIYGSLLLFVGWALAWPVYSVFRKFSGKQAV